MRISMGAQFQILKNVGGGAFVPMNEREAIDVGIGGFSFRVGDKAVPFDWSAFTGCWGENEVLNFLTGYGWVNDFELDSCYDEAYAEIGLKREDISAKFLASTHHIEDFFVYFIHDGEEREVGFCENNASCDARYKLKLFKVVFSDVDTETMYEVASKVLDSFNKGDKAVLLDSVLESAVQKSNDFGLNKKVSEYEVERC